MRAAFLTSLRKVEVRQTPEPQLAAPGEVLLEIETVGVCGSDMHYYRAGRIGEQIVQYPWIVGHECAGRVVQVAPDVKGLSPGQRVAVDPLVYCGRCDQCRLGHVHTCRNQRFLGCPGQLTGSLAERIVMPATSCFAIPDSMTMTQATLSEPLSIALWACKLAAPAEGAAIGILGSGPIGLSVLAACKAAGACTVYQTDLLDNRLDAARRMGADWTANPTATDVVAAIGDAQGEGLDVVFECAGEQETIDQAVRLLKPCSKLLAIGIFETDRVHFDISLMRRKELQVQNVRRQLHCARPAIEMIAAGRVNVDAMVTHEFTMDQTQQAFDMVADYRDNAIKAMIHLAPGG